MKYYELDENKREELKTTIYNLREQKLVYSKITEELEKQNICISDSTVRKICKDIYNAKGKKEPVIERDRIEVNDEQIYDLREKGLTYKEIAQELKKQGIDISNTTVGQKCKEIYSAKGKEEPKIDNRTYKLREKEHENINLDGKLAQQDFELSKMNVSQRTKGKNTSKTNREFNSIQERNEKIYNLRQQGWSCQMIANEFNLSTSLISLICKQMENLRQDKNQRIKRRRHNNISDESKELEETIYKLREQGLSYKEILDKVKGCSSITTKQGVAQRYKKVFEYNEEQLAKIILNLVITKKATIKQIQEMADYYGVNLEKTMNSLDER